MAVLCTLSLLVAWHLVWAQSRIRPPVPLTDELALRAGTSGSNTGLEGGFRVVEANGQPVRDRRELYRVFDQGPKSGASLLVRREVDGAREERRVLWRPVALVPEIAIAEGLTVAARALDPVRGEGDVRILQINGDTPLDRSTALRLISRPRAETRLTVGRPGSAAPTVDVVFFIRSWRVQWAVWIVGYAFCLLGWGVLYLKPCQRSSWGFAGFAIGVGFFSLLRSIPHPHRLSSESLAYLAIQALLPPLFAAFLLTFTPLRQFVRPTRRWLYAAGGFGAALLALDFLRYRESANVGLLGQPLFVIWLVATLALLLLAQPADLYLRLRGVPVGATDRQRARILRLATVAAFVPIPAFYLALLSGVVRLEERFWVELAVLIFPLAIAYAIVRNNLLEIHELLRESLLAGGLLLCVAAVHAASAAGFVPLVTSLLPSSSAWVQPTVLAISILSLTPLYLQSRAAVRRRFEPSRDFEALAVAFDETIQPGTTAPQFCEMAVRKISAAADWAGVHFLLYEKRAGWWLAATTHLNPEGPDHQRATQALDLLRLHRRPVMRDELLETLGDRTTRLFALDGMRELGASVLLPLVSRGRLLAALAIGDRDDGRNFLAEDLRLLERITARLSQQLDSFYQDTRGRPRRIVDLFPDFPPRIGPFEVERVLGEGGTAYVYLGRNASRPVAIKVPKDKVQSNEQALQRFHRESLAMERLQHPHISRVIEVGWHHREPYIAFEYFERGSLDAHLERLGRLEEKDAIAIVHQMVTALAAALERGIIHRDVKLRNMFLADDSTVKLGDFGLALVEDATTLTTHPMLMGTPAYMSPEQVKGEPATWKSDQYALGICLYELLAGELPFKADTVDALLYLHLRKNVPDITMARRDVTTATRLVLQRMAAKKPAARFESYDALAAALAGLAIGMNAEYWKGERKLDTI